MALAFCERCIYNMAKTLFGDDRFVGFDSWEISLWAGKVIVDTAERIYKKKRGEEGLGG